MEREKKTGEIHAGGSGDVVEWELQNKKEKNCRAEEVCCLLRLMYLVTQANEPQLDSSQLTLAIRLRLRGNEKRRSREVMEEEKRE